MTYTEGGNGITINNAMPTTDENGKKITEVSQMFDFTVDIAVAGKTNVSYEVTAIKQNTSTLSNENVKLYLERRDNDISYSEVMAPSIYTPINDKNEFGAQPGEMILDTNTVTSASKLYYRLRMWVAKEYVLDDTPRSFTVKVNVYGIGGSTPSKPVPKICKRATTLHTETCGYTRTDAYCSGAGYTTTVTYGNLGTAGTLTSCDAFDCDVNGDGIYDTANTLAYEESSHAYLNGPVTAIKHLPSSNRLSNVSLTNSIRDITDEFGTVRKTGFS